MKIGIQLLQLLTCVLFLTVIAINKEQKVFNKEVSTFFVDQPKELDTWVTDDGLTVITTQRIGKEVFGYAGNIPLNLYLKGDKIERIELLKNAETPSFLKRATKSGLLESWNGLTLSQAQEKKIDAVSGATLSSSAIIESVNIAAQFGTDNSLVKGRSFDWGDVRFWAVLIVVLIGMILPLCYKNKYYRIIQLTLNVAVLGFWSGSFISLSLLVNILANGVNFWLFIIPFLLIVTAFIYPLFGKKNHYCTWICPLGACQELLNKSVPYKISISNRVLKYLDYFREGLFIFLLTIMWLGVGFEAMDYELFSVFLFQSASSYLLIAGAVFAVLSCFVQRPYCRFVCPTGSLFKFSERSK